MAGKRRRSPQKIDWDNIEIEIVPIDEPNPHSPYSELTPEARLLRLQKIYQRIYAGRIDRLMRKTEDK